MIGEDRVLSSANRRRAPARELLNDQYSGKAAMHCCVLQRGCTSMSAGHTLGFMETPTGAQLTRSDAVYLEKRGHIAELILNRPAVLNAENWQMADAFHAA